MSRVVVLGAGRVAPPLVEYLARTEGRAITVVSSVRAEAEGIARLYRNATAEVLDVAADQEALAQLVKRCEVVVCLLPATMHVLVARICIRYKANMVTASYSTPEMVELHSAAQEAGITIINEVGLDPGIDHFLALDCFDEVHSKGGKVVSFVSMCGGLPAPECADNPLKYKFSWDPCAALKNNMRGSKYIKDNEVIELEDGGATFDATDTYVISPSLVLEGFPNRDSTVYRALYGLSEAHTVLRGTLRYPGYVRVVRDLIKLGLLDSGCHCSLQTEDGAPATWREFVCSLIGVEVSRQWTSEEAVAAVRGRVGQETALALDGLGLLQQSPVRGLTPLDALAALLQETLCYKTAERDLVALQHRVAVAWPGGVTEHRTITMLCYGQPGGHSAMATTVGYTCAIATELVLSGDISQAGVILPFSPATYRTILCRLADEGIQATTELLRQP